MTSGFNAVTHAFFQEKLQNLKNYILEGDLFKLGSGQELLKEGRDQEEITGYLNAIAAQDTYTDELHTCSRLYRKITEDGKYASDVQVVKFIDEQFAIMKDLPPGKVEPISVQRIKGWIREWEAELVWAHFGIGVDQVTHLGLEFYKGEIFPEDPKYDRDVKPILAQLEKLKPDVVTLALDPEGSGPDTHFKVLMAIAAALEKYVETHGADELEI